MLQDCTFFKEKQQYAIKSIHKIKDIQYHLYLNKF